MISRMMLRLCVALLLVLSVTGVVAFGGEDPFESFFALASTRGVGEGGTPRVPGGEADVPSGASGSPSRGSDQVKGTGTGKATPGAEARGVGGASPEQAGRNGGVQGEGKQGAVTMPAASPSSPLPGARQEAGSGSLVFNFDDADLHEVIKTLGDLLQITYVVDPNVKGKVTIHTAGTITQSDLLTLFFQILDVNGLTAVKERNIYKIVPMKDVSRSPLLSRMGAEGLAPEERVMIQIIPLRHMSAAEMTKLLTPFVSAGGVIASEAGSNTLLVVDRGANIQKVLKLVDAFDVDLFQKVHVKVFPLKYTEAAEAADLLREGFAAFMPVGREDVKFLAIERLNTILVVSPNPELFEKVKILLREIDVMDHDIQPKLYVYFVRNGDAGDLADILNEIFGVAQTTSQREKRDQRQEKKREAYQSRNPLSKSRSTGTGSTGTLGGTGTTGSRYGRTGSQLGQSLETARTQKKDTTGTRTGGGTMGRTERTGERLERQGGTLKAEVAITGDTTRNALIIQAVPADYRTIEVVLKQLDVMPRQVLIEATIAEITRDASTDLGVQWAFGQGAGLGNASFKAGISGDKGLTYSLGVTDKWYAALNALASQNKVNVLSSPHVLASDNTEARIDISREIPIASSEWTFTSGTEPVTQTNIQYRDAGVILVVTPHINDKGLVTMEISQEVSELSDNIKVGGVEYPSFFKRAITTTLAVAHGQTLAIGGLIKDKEDEKMSGVPCLINIPGARYLFGTYGKSTEKTELIVLITPRVVVNLEDVDAVTEEFKRKVRGVVDRFKR